MKDTFYKSIIEEQETIINIDYCKKEISLYTNRRSVYERIAKKIGKPIKEYYIDKKISGAKWTKSFKNIYKN